jgi:hypothetical protein
VYLWVETWMVAWNCGKCKDTCSLLLLGTQVKQW